MGCCAYGNSCRYVHHKPNNITNPAVKEKKMEPLLSKPIPGPVSLAAAAGLQFDSGVHLFIHSSFIRSSIQSLIYPCIHLFIHPIAHLSMHSFIHPSNGSSIHAFIYSSIQSLIYPCIHLFIHSIAHLSMHSFIHPSNRSSIHAFIYSSIQFLIYTIYSTTITTTHKVFQVFIITFSNNLYFR